MRAFFVEDVPSTAVAEEDATGSFDALDALKRRLAADGAALAKFKVACLVAMLRTQEMRAKASRLSKERKKSTRVVS